MKVKSLCYYMALIFLSAAMPVTDTLARNDVTFWFHAAAEDNPESRIMNQQVQRFNASQNRHEVTMLKLPEYGYESAVLATALTGGLPDLLDFDGPNIANYVWLGYLQPLNRYIPRAIIDNLLPSIKMQGTYPADKKLYSIGTFDSGLALWGNKKLLRKAGIRVPQSLSQAWSLSEFENVLSTLNRTPGVSYPLDIKLNYGEGEWFTYGFSPLIQSMGGDLINRTSWRAAGSLDAAGSVRAMTALQSWYKQGWIVPASKGDSTFYQAQDVGLCLVGHWMWSAHSEALGDDLALIPMPKFGAQHVTGMGSWSFGISANARNPRGAAEFLIFLLRDEEILRMANANGAVPATLSALKNSKNFSSPQSPLHLYSEQLISIALNRPFHPAYPAISAAFAEAAAKILKGADVQKELTRAANAVDEEIEDNQGYYPFIKK